MEGFAPLPSEVTPGASHLVACRWGGGTHPWPFGPQVRAALPSRPLLGAAASQARFTINKAHSPPLRGAMLD